MSIRTETSEAVREPGSARRRLAAVVVLTAAVISAWWLFRDQLTLRELALHEAALREYQRDHWWLMYAAAFGLYVIVAACSIPAATVLTLTIGWLFGFRYGLPLVSFASTAGATIAFLVSRYLLRDYVAGRCARWVPRMTAALERDGALYLFAMRLTPAVPFVVINVVLGLTRLRARTFWWVSQLGMLPATALFVYAGSTVPDLQQLAQRGLQGVITIPLATAFVLLGLFPFAARWLMARFRPQRNAGTNPDTAR